MDNNYQGESFLNRLYKDLHISEEVMHTALPSDTKDEKVSKYLDRLEKIEEVAINSKYNGLELLKEMYYKKYIIKAENVPESYFELQKKIALERGFGYVNVSSKEKKQMIDAIINDQKKSLDVWLDYLISNDSLYPEWFKYYAFQGMLKLGSYDKAKASFNKRTNSTTNVFIDLNSEALALVYDNLCYSLEGNKVDDELLQKLLDSGSFSKLYAYMLRTIDNSNKDIHSNDGIWIKYNQGSSPDDLVKSLAGKGTGWCTAGIETARTQLQGGDFYVYYTKDSNNEYKQPRIAIRMEESSIGEIRGIASNQNLEPEMEEIVDKKLEEFPDKDKYKKKVNDMKLLTEIYNNYKNRDLTIEELRFLYEIDSKIDGFGYQTDPRIEEILDGRNIKKDFAKAFSCSEDEISNNINDVLQGKKIIYFIGDLDLSSLVNINGLSLPKYVSGSLDLSNLINIEGLTLPINVGGNLDLGNIKSANGLVLPTNVGGYLSLSDLISTEGLIFPTNVGGDLYLFVVENMDNIILPNDIGGSLYLCDLKNIENVIFPNRIGGTLYLESLTEVENLKLSSNIGEDLYMYKLKNAKNVIFPNRIGGSLSLDNLINAKNLTFPSFIGEYLNLSKLKVAKNLVLPDKLGGYLNLKSLKETENLVLPNEVDGNVYLNELEKAENVTLPNIIYYKLCLNKLTNTEGLIVPVDFYYCRLVSDYISIGDLKAKSLEINQNNLKQKGFSKIGILILLDLIISIGLIFLGVWISL